MGAQPVAHTPSESHVPAVPSNLIRQRVTITGTVQGVGFRPFVYRHAGRLGLAGFVHNTGESLLFEAEGRAADVEELLRLVRDCPPPAARLESLTVTECQCSGDFDPFQIRQSKEENPAGSGIAPLSPDLALCADCTAEMENPHDRRHDHAFASCTACGPRYTMTKALPYDRNNTTMANFALCRACKKEYENPGDRRFHAQPIACLDCGPHLTFHKKDATLLAGGKEALKAAVQCLTAGGILAIKGIGGYHLAVDAGNPVAVAKLRHRKKRPHKPFAVMVPDLSTAQQLCLLNTPATTALCAAAAPVVLAPRRLPRTKEATTAKHATSNTGSNTSKVTGKSPKANNPNSLAPTDPGTDPGTDPVENSKNTQGSTAIAAWEIAAEVAPGLVELGLFLPYTSLHHLLIRRFGRPLVMTSANVSGAPIVRDTEEAHAVLGPLSEGMLTHDRTIATRCDDSVVRSMTQRVQVLRRSRGLVPLPFRLPHGIRAEKPILAMGGMGKNTVAIAQGEWVTLSHHIGDLTGPGWSEAFFEGIEHLLMVCEAIPTTVAHDLHPDYPSTVFATGLDLPATGVQHHHAHIASCLVEHGLTGPVLGIAFDGHGYGLDAGNWGGEFLLVDLRTSRRVGHLRRVPLTGGDRAAREPWRMALSWVQAAEGEEKASAWAAYHAKRQALSPTPFWEGGNENTAEGVLSLSRSFTQRGISLTSSAGRLFDAIAAIVATHTTLQNKKTTYAGTHGATYEGQAAIELEALASHTADEEGSLWSPRLSLNRTDNNIAADTRNSGQDKHTYETDGCAILDPAPLVRNARAATEKGVFPSRVAASFHDNFAIATAHFAASLARREGVQKIVLSGGVFQNRRFSEKVEQELHQQEFAVFTHTTVPANDGGISLGQAAVAAARAQHPL